MCAATERHRKDTGLPGFVRGSSAAVFTVENTVTRQGTASAIAASAEASLRRQGAMPQDDTSASSEDLRVCAAAAILVMPICGT